MLSDLQTFGDWYLSEKEQERGWDFDEIRLEGDIQAALIKADPSYTVFNYSAKAKYKSGNHAFIPSQYLMYALKVKPLVMLVRNYISVLDSVEAAMGPEDLHKYINELPQPTRKAKFNAAIKHLDSFSQSNFTEFVISAKYRLGTKNLTNPPNKKNPRHTYRGGLDIQKSIVLGALPVANENSGALAPLFSLILANPVLLEALEDRYLRYIPYVFRSTSGDDLLFKVMSTLGWMDKMEAIVEHIQITPGGDIYPWDNIPDAFLLLNNPENKSNANYSESPIHYSQSLKKYIFIRKGLISTQADREQVNTLLDRAWPGMSIIESTEGSSTTYLYTSTRRQRSAMRLTGGRNEIIYGAPGTGKSHSIKQEIASEDAAEITTVFHADTQYSDFVGSLKPKTEKNARGKTRITYEFRPGPFTDAYVEAVTKPSKKVYLVIEEINRAPAAAVFGEIFQLLDRSREGESSYGITPADPDMLAYIASQTGEKCTKLKLPANLFLSATMNSSDQAVMPMDTAFKRRWSFRYMEINFTAPEVPDAEITLFLDEHGSEKEGYYTISWKNFAEKVINHMLKEFNVAEDRLIGPFFLNSKELHNPEAARESLSGKLFPYIWDDVLRHMPNERARLFSDVQTYGDLYARFNQEPAQKSVFSEEVAGLIRNLDENEDTGQDEST